MITVTLLKKDDCDEIVEWHKDKDENFLKQWTGSNKYTFPLTASMIRSRLLEEGTMIYKVLNDGEMIGTVELGKFNDVLESATISRFLIRDLDLRKGYGSEVIELLKAIVFDEIGLKKLKLNVLTSNTPAIQCYQKAGFDIVATHGDESGEGYHAMALEKVLV